MKKFIVKSLLFIIFGSIFMYILNEQYINTNGFKRLNGTNKFLNTPYHIEIANMGSSHGQKSFAYDKLGVRGFNFALSAQNFYYDYQILKQYKDHFERHAIILLPVSFQSFGDFDEQRFEEIRPRYYRFLNDEYIQGFLFKEKILYKYLPIIGAEKNLMFLIRDIKEITESWEKTTKNKYKDKEIVKIAQKRAKSHMEINSLADHEINTKILKEMIIYCKYNELIPVLITTPFTKYYNDSFSEKYKSEFFAEVENVAREEGIIYLNYFSDKRFSNNLELFIDADHLNLIGREEFTKVVISDLKRLNLLY